jgi:dipeptidyl aminopeptidase/acylaminoacyl peptidase
VFSPDGSLVAFAGTVVEDWDADPHFFVVPADGSGSAEPIAPQDDRPAPLIPGLPSPLVWTGDWDLLILLADRGSVTLHRARIGQARSRELIGGDIQIDGFALRRGRRTLVYTASWVDRLSEIFATTASGGTPKQLTHFNDEFVAEVELAPATRATVVRPDGTEVEYFTIAPPGRRSCRSTSMSTAAPTGPGRAAGGSPSTRQPPRRATSYYSRIPGAASATARSSPPRAPATGAVATTRTSSPVAMT